MNMHGFPPLLSTSMFLVWLVMRLGWSERFILRGWCTFLLHWISGCSMRYTSVERGGPWHVVGSRFKDVCFRWCRVRGIFFQALVL